MTRKSHEIALRPTETSPDIVCAAMRFMRVFLTTTCAC